MQFYVGDFLASTLHLSLEQKGAYALVMFGMWNAGGSLPNDPAKLARVCGVTLKRWCHISPEILEFFDSDGDQLTQKRLAAEYRKGLEIIQKRSTAGKLGNSAKSLKSNNPTSANANATVERGDRISESPSSSESEPKREEGKDSSLPMHLPVVHERNNTQRTKRTKADPAELETDFIEFMRQFPKPDDPGTAKPAYKRARRKASAADLLNGAMRYSIEKDGTDPQFIKTPRNWLDAEAWKNPARPPSATVGRHQDPQLAQVAGFLTRSS
jgi:uncharacterized protein YdaU (DUF1376 family)